MNVKAEIKKFANRVWQPTAEGRALYNALLRDK